MPNPEKAVAVARDVIEQLDAEHPYRPSCGTYIDYGSWHSIPGMLPTDDFQKHVSAIQKGGCRVCAIGAAVLSKAKLFDAVPVQSALEGYYHQTLRDVFDDETIVLMETAFECCSVIQVPALKSVDLNLIMRAVHFGNRYEDRGDRMKAIMNNIINNDGRFVPDA